MILDDVQFLKVKSHILHEGVKNAALQDDLIDHFCCVIEEYLDKGHAFNEAFKMAKKRIIPEGAQKIENDLNYLLTVNNEIMLRKLVFILGYISVFQIITAFAIYLPGFVDQQVASMIAMGGIFTFSLTVIPFYFYQQYKRSVHKLKES